MNGAECWRIRQLDVTKAVLYRGQFIGGKVAKGDAGCSLVLIDRHAHWQRLTLGVWPTRFYLVGGRWKIIMMIIIIILCIYWFLNLGTEGKRI